LADFSERDRRFVELYYGAGLLPEEVATAMNISVKTVYSKKNKLRSKLLALAGQAPQADDDAPRRAA
ncbi:MAG TPA: ECF-type sigma factor, partial [Polyangia bacterium]|nr:ECF-type sigma factor [Polyangia bacterium]